MIDPHFRCIVCNRQLEPEPGFTPGPRVPIDRGTYWESTGNWGSTVHDGPDCSLFVVVICDWCLEERVKRVREYRLDGTGQARSPGFSGSHGPGPKPTPEPET